MNRITIEEIRELLASIAKIDTLVANNEIFIIKEILQKIDDQKRFVITNIEKLKKMELDYF